MRKMILYLPSITQESDSRVFILMAIYLKRLVSVDNINSESKYKDKRILT